MNDGLSPFGSDPVLAAILQHEWSGDRAFLATELRRHGYGKLATSLELEPIRYAGIDDREIARRLAPTPPAGWFRRAMRLTGLGGPDAPGRIW